MTITLPTAVDIYGTEYVIKNIGAGVVTIATTNSETVDGAAPANMATQWICRRYVSDGANWILT